MCAGRFVGSGDNRRATAGRSGCPGTEFSPSVPTPAQFARRMICGQKIARDCQFGEFGLNFRPPSSLSLSYIGTSLRMVSHLSKECNNGTWTKVVQPTKCEIRENRTDSTIYEG